MSDYLYGKSAVTVLSSAQALPNTTSADSTNTIDMGLLRGGLLWISVYAHTAITFATDKLAYIEFEVYSADTAASMVAPFSYNNSGTQTAVTVPHFYPFYHAGASGGAVSFAAGDLITQFGVPMELLNKMGYRYGHLKYYSAEDLSAYSVDAFAHVIM